MSWPARYDGHCLCCEERIHQGDQVKWADDVVVHADCDVLDSAGRSVPEVCSRCHLVPSASGVCGCDE